MLNILSDSSKFTQVFVAEDKQLNFIVMVEKHITDLLKDIENSEVIPKTVYKSLKNSCLITVHLLDLLCQ